MLADESEWALFLKEADLAGLPDFLKASMAEAAETRGHKGRYAVTLSRSIYEPFTTFSERRDLREAAWRAFTMRGENGGSSDNTDVVRDLLTLRAEKAKLLGYASYAALKLDDTMAKTPQAVHALLDPVWQRRGKRPPPTRRNWSGWRRRPAATRASRPGTGASTRKSCAPRNSPSTRQN